MHRGSLAQAHVYNIKLYELEDILNDKKFLNTFVLRNSNVNYEISDHSVREAVKSEIAIIKAAMEKLGVIF